MQEAKCKPSSSAEKVKNAVYGHPCNTNGTGYDDTRCVFLRCQNGYYQSNLTECSKIPDSPSPTPDPSTKHGLKAWQIILIAVGSTFFVSVVVIVLVIVLVRRPRRSPSREITMGLLSNKEDSDAQNSYTPTYPTASVAEQIAGSADLKNDAV